MEFRRVLVRSQDIASRLYRGALWITSLAWRLNGLVPNLVTPFPIVSTAATMAASCPFSRRMASGKDMAIGCKVVSGYWRSCGDVPPINLRGDRKGVV